LYKPIVKPKDGFMEIIVKKWGNSLAARIPKAIADMID